MKKTNLRLKLQYTTVRKLTNNALARVAGGKPQDLNTYPLSADCPGTLYTGCDPEFYDPTFIVCATQRC